MSDLYVRLTTSGTNSTWELSTDNRTWTAFSTDETNPPEVTVGSNANSLGIMVVSGCPSASTVKIDVCFVNQAVVGSGGIDVQVPFAWPAPSGKQLVRIDAKCIEPTTTVQASGYVKVKRSG